MNRRCPYCDQVLPEFRLGVRLPPLKARIYDLVCRGGRDGIETGDLLELAYNVPDAHAGVGTGNGKRHGPHNVKTLHNHIQQINELIEDAGYRVVNGNGRYRLERRD